MSLLDRHRTRDLTNFQRLAPACHEIAAPLADRALAHLQGLCDPARRPTHERQKERPRPIRFAPVTDGCLTTPATSLDPLIRP